jgi:hypothetical protein
MGWKSEKLWFNSWQGQQTYLFSKYQTDHRGLPCLLINGHRRWGSFLRYHSPTSSAEVTNKWSCTSTYAYANTACTWLHSFGIKMNNWSTAPAVCTFTFCIASQHLHRHAIHQLRLFTEQCHISWHTCVGATQSSSVQYTTLKFYQC